MSKVIIEPLTKEQLEERKVWAEEQFQRNYDAVTEIRRYEYNIKSDPIFFQYQRGEKTEQEWLDAVKAVNEANPYPEQPS